MLLGKKQIDGFYKNCVYFVIILTNQANLVNMNK